MVTARAYVNGDDCFLAWVSPFIPGCRGFAITRDLDVATTGVHESEVLPNRVGFVGQEAQPNGQKPSTEWPFQRYTWTDHGVSEGDTVRYTITPMVATAAGLEADEAGSATVGPLIVTASAQPGMHAWFNRGTLLSQFMARRLGPHFTDGDLLALKAELAQHDDDLRGFLMGQLGAQLLDLLARAAADGSHVYAALYELDDADLVAALKVLGDRAHVVLSNGSATKKGADGNRAAAEELNDAVDLHRRMLWSEGLGHNKFVVIAASPTEPVAVWTGSTNWATTGLCTQLNNAVLVEDPALAGVYLEQWTRLRDDARVGQGGQPKHFGPALLAANDELKTGSAGAATWTVWFTRTTDGRDIAAATELINGATQAILFLMFAPGDGGLLPVVQARLADPGLYMHGVVNTLKPAPAGQAVTVDLVAKGKRRPFDLRVIQPEGVKGGLAQWATEVTRADFLLDQGGVIGHAIVHSKVIVLDPFTNPVVITGSHNFSKPASTKNDENLLIVAGNAALAERYAVNILSYYQHYRWRAYLQECASRGVSPWQGLADDDRWQKRPAEHDDELRFWLQLQDGPDGVGMAPGLS